MIHHQKHVLRIDSQSAKRDKVTSGQDFSTKPEAKIDGQICTYWFTSLDQLPIKN